MWFCPLQETAFVHIHMHPANLDSTQSSSSHPPIFLITAMAQVLVAVFQIKSIAHKGLPEFSKQYSLVHLALALISALCERLPSFRRNGFSCHSTLLWSTAEICMPVTQLPVLVTSAQTSWEIPARATKLLCLRRSPI